MSLADPRIVAVIPCYNEEKTISQIILRVKKYVDKVIVINDGSSDNTAILSKQAGAFVISHPYNVGKGAALDTAFKYLRTINCDFAVFLDGDGQHDPDDVPQVISPICEGKADMVIGSRFLSGSSEIPFYRKVGQIVLNIATNIGSAVKVTDSQSGFRGFSRKAINIMSFKEKGLSVESEMQFIAGHSNLKVSEVPIKTIYFSHLKRNPVKHGLNVLLRIMSISITNRQYYNTKF